MGSDGGFLYTAAVEPGILADDNVALQLVDTVAVLYVIPPDDITGGNDIGTPDLSFTGYHGLGIIVQEVLNLLADFLIDNMEVQASLAH